jgi:hypothetical protein
MSFTYSGDPANSPLDAVRYHIGDIEEAKCLVQDEEIDYALAEESDVRLASANVAEAIAARATREVSWVRGRVEYRPGEMADRYYKLAAQLRDQVTGAGSYGVDSAYAGGISAQTVAAAEADADRIEPRFKRDQFDS